jgi:hypothetical protein
MYFSGGMVYIPELKEARERWHVSFALLNLGGAAVQLSSVELTLQITMMARRLCSLSGRLAPM